MAAENTAPITTNDRLYRSVKEGKATILAPYQTQQTKSAKKPNVVQSGQPRNNDEGDQAVFYNPIQQYNRDLSVLAILVYGESALAHKRVRHEKNLQKDKKKKKQKQLGRANLSLLDTANATIQNEESGSVATVESLKADQSAAANAYEKTLQEVQTDFQYKRKVDNTDFDTNIQNEVQKRKRSNQEHPLGGTNGRDVETAPQTLDTNPDKARSLSGTESQKTPSHSRFTILDALSASGLRAIRYAHEIPFATTVVANDLLPEATEAIKLNIEHNELGNRVYANTGDARQFMYSKTGNESTKQGPGYVHKFDVVDLDPYGTAAPFIDAALQAVVDGGLLCVTCTDAGVWASNGYPEKAYALYGGTPMKGAHSHEAGLRLILHSIATAAAKYGLAIEPLLSLSIDFYGRVFIRVHKSQQDVKLLAGTSMVVYNCDQGCGAWQTQLLARNSIKKGKNNEDYFKHGFAQGPSADRYCEHCGTKMHLGGPVWAGPIHNPVFISKVLDKLPNCDKTIYGTTERIKGMLNVALQEEDIGWPAKSSSQAQPLANDTENDTTTITNDAVQIPQQSAIIPRMPPELLSPAPFFFLPTYLAKVLSLPTPAEDPFRGALLALGYACSRSHCKPGSFKTDAPWNVIWEVVREWARQKETDRLPRLFGEGEFAEKGSVKRPSPGWHILQRMRERDVQVMRIRERLLHQLSFSSNASVGLRGPPYLQHVLKSALYELEHPTAAGTTSSSAQHDSSENPQDTNTTNGHENKSSGKALINAGADVSELQIVFDADLGRAFRESGGKLVRYQMNPRANWGPMVRAGGGNGVSSTNENMNETAS